MEHFGLGHAAGDGTRGGEGVGLPGSFPSCLLFLISAEQVPGLPI